MTLLGFQLKLPDPGEWWLILQHPGKRTSLFFGYCSCEVAVFGWNEIHPILTRRRAFCNSQETEYDQFSHLGRGVLSGGKGQGTKKLTRTSNCRMLDNLTNHTHRSLGINLTPHHRALFCKLFHSSFGLLEFGRNFLNCHRTVAFATIPKCAMCCSAQNKVCVL